MKKISLMIIVTMSIFATSCDNDMYSGCKNFPEQMAETGEIIKNARVKYSNTNLTSFNPKNGYVITSDSENDFDLVVSFDEGTTYHPIDFSKYTLLGKATSESCRMICDKNVIKKIKNKKYIYEITVFHCGTCKKLISDMNWVLIPKIEDDFSVEFVVNYKHWNNGR